MNIILAFLLLVIASVDGFKLKNMNTRIRNPSTTSQHAVLPGSPIVVGTITQGMANAVGLFSNIILARFALSWFPQLPRQFPILRPIFTVTEPYLKIFRSQIPPVAGLFGHLIDYISNFQ
jgi:hypothetical protein